MEHILTHNRQFRAGNQDSITYPELPKHSFGGGLSTMADPQGSSPHKFLVICQVVPATEIR